MMSEPLVLATIAAMAIGAALEMWRETRTESHWRRSIEERLAEVESRLQAVFDLGMPKKEDK
jgi:hypothetical protein